jgi:hypothetical protein
VTRSAEVIPYSAYSELFTIQSVVDNTVEIASKVHDQQYTVDEVLIDGTVIRYSTAAVGYSTVDAVLKQHVDTTVYSTTVKTLETRHEYENQFEIQWKREMTLLKASSSSSTAKVNSMMPSLTKIESRKMHAQIQLLRAESHAQQKETRK